MKAWHFVGDTLRDGRPIPADGVKLIHPREPMMCVSGLHASLDPFDALEYALGPNLCLVECGGTVLHQQDKLVCTERTILARMDAGPLLLHFARQQALSVVHLWDAPPVVLDYLMGDDAARAAAMAATCDAAWAAAGAAARAVAWAVAAMDAARTAARTAARDEFNDLAREAFEDWI
jgi:hypothetical protein